jgi:hypothetical protein
MDLPGFSSANSFWASPDKTENIRWCWRENDSLPDWFPPKPRRRELFFGGRFASFFHFPSSIFDALADFFAGFLHFFGRVVDMLTDFLSGVIDPLTECFGGPFHFFNCIVDTLANFLGSPFIFAGRQSDDSEGKKKPRETWCVLVAGSSKFLSWK